MYDILHVLEGSCLLRRLEPGKYRWCGWQALLNLAASQSAARAMQAEVESNARQYEAILCRVAQLVLLQLILCSSPSSPLSVSRITNYTAQLLLGSATEDGQEKELQRLKRRVYEVISVLDAVGIVVKLTGRSNTIRVAINTGLQGVAMSAQGMTDGAPVDGADGEDGQADRISSANAPEGAPMPLGYEQRMPVAAPEPLRSFGEPAYLARGRTEYGVPDGAGPAWHQGSSAAGWSLPPPSAGGGASGGAGPAGAAGAAGSGAGMGMGAARPAGAGTGASESALSPSGYTFRYPSAAAGYPYSLSYDASRGAGDSAAAWAAARGRGAGMTGLPAYSLAAGGNFDDRERPLYSMRAPGDARAFGPRGEYREAAGALGAEARGPYASSTLQYAHQYLQTHPYVYQHGRMARPEVGSAEQNGYPLRFVSHGSHAALAAPAAPAVPAGLPGGSEAALRRRAAAAGTSSDSLHSAGNASAAILGRTQSSEALSSDSARSAGNASVATHGRTQGSAATPATPQSAEARMPAMHWQGAIGVRGPAAYGGARYGAVPAVASAATPAAVDGGEQGAAAAARSGIPLHDASATAASMHAGHRQFVSPYAGVPFQARDPAPSAAFLRAYNAAYAAAADQWPQVAAEAGLPGAMKRQREDWTVEGQPAATRAVPAHWASQAEVLRGSTPTAPAAPAASARPSASPAKYAGPPRAHGAPLHGLASSSPAGSSAGMHLPASNSRGRMAMSMMVHGAAQEAELASRMVAPGGYVDREGAAAAIAVPMARGNSAQLLQ